MVAIGVLCALFAGVFRYADQHFYDEETFLENTSGLGTNADIRERLFDGFKAEIIRFADGDVEVDETNTSITDELDSTSDATDPVTAERNLRIIEIENILIKVFNNNGDCTDPDTALATCEREPNADYLYANDYQAQFDDALKSTRQQLIRSAELESEALLGDNGDVFFDMRGLYQPLWAEFAQNELTIAIPQNEVPLDYGIFKVADRDTTLDYLWAFLRNAPSWRGLATLAAIFSFVGAVAVAERRPSTAIQFGGGIVGVGVVLIVILFLIRFIVPLLAGGGTSASAVAATYVENVTPLVGVMIRLVILGLVIAALGGIAKLIWPDDWVYSSVSDDRGVRSVRHRRRGRNNEPEPQPVAAAAPVAYPMRRSSIPVIRRSSGASRIRASTHRATAVIPLGHMPSNPNNGASNPAASNHATSNPAAPNHRTAAVHESGSANRSRHAGADPR